MSIMIRRLIVLCTIAVCSYIGSEMIVCDDGTTCTNVAGTWVCH